MDPYNDNEKEGGYVNPLKAQFPELFRSDVSIYPSYTNLRIPYNYVCRQRYHDTKQLYRRQFLKELHSLEMLQDRAIEGIRIQRIFTKGLKIPKSMETADPLTPAQRRRVEEIMEGRAGL